MAKVRLEQTAIQIPPLEEPALKPGEGHVHSEPKFPHMD